MLKHRYSVRSCAKPFADATGYFPKGILEGRYCMFNLKKIKLGGLVRWFIC